MTAFNSFALALVSAVVATWFAVARDWIVDQPWQFGVAVLLVFGSAYALGRLMRGRGPIRVGGALLTMILLAIPTFLLAVAPYLIRPDKQACEIPNKGLGLGVTPAVETPGRLVLQEGQDTTLTFGRDLRVKKLELRFDVEPAGEADTAGAEEPVIVERRPQVERDKDLVRVSVSQFLRDDDARIPPIDVRQEAELKDDEVLVTLCIDRRELGHLGPRPGLTPSPSPSPSTPARETILDPPWPNPGEYKGMVTVVDPRFAKTSVPITVTFAYPHWNLPALGLYAVVLLGSVWIWILKRQLKDEDVLLEKAKLNDLKKWLKQWGGIAAILAGITGAWAVFAADYLSSPTWGSSSKDAVAFMVSMFTAFVATSTTTRIVASGKGPSKGPTEIPADEEATLEPDDSPEAVKEAGMSLGGVPRSRSRGGRSSIRETD